MTQKNKKSGEIDLTSLSQEELWSLAEDSHTDPKTLRKIFELERSRSDTRLMRFLIRNPNCTADIKREYAEYALDTGLLGHVQTAAGREMIDNMSRALQSWRPPKAVQPEIKIDITDPEVKKILDVTIQKRQVIFYGPPGTSKTYRARGIAQELAEGDPSRIKFVQFHPSYTYEDFVEGIFPVEPEKPGDPVLFRKQPKLFKEFCKIAENGPTDRLYMLIIDEINRADLGRVFGELLTCLEYRGEEASLIYSPDETFRIPQNLVVLGTMNTLDKSTIDVDYALRRRFYFYRIGPDVEVLRRDILEPNGLGPDWIDRVSDFFSLINDTGRQDLYFPLGHAYFKDVKNKEDLAIVWEHSIGPLLEEYFGEFERRKFERIRDAYQNMLYGEPEKREE